MASQAATDQRIRVNNTIAEFASVVQVCDEIHGFHQRSSALLPFAKQAILEAIRRSTKASQANVTSITPRLAIRRDTARDQQQLEEAHGSNEQYQQVSNIGSCAGPRSGTHSEDDRSQMRTDVAQKTLHADETGQHHHTGTSQHQGSRVTPYVTSVDQQAFGQHTPPQRPLNSGLDQSHGPAQFANALFHAENRPLHTFTGVGEICLEHLRERSLMPGLYSNQPHSRYAARYFGQASTLAQSTTPQETMPDPLIVMNENTGIEQNLQSQCYQQGNSVAFQNIPDWGGWISEALDDVYNLT
jgi:hypothetical protein